jgi:uncharacterized protein YraI/beta-lactamase class A
MQARRSQLIPGVLIVSLMLAWLIAAPFAGARSPSDQGAPEVYAEAIGQANLRGGPGIEYPVVGEIMAGTRYRVLGQHALVPWLRLDYPAASDAWVYTELVTVSGNLALVPVTEDFPPIGDVPTFTPTSAAPVEQADSTLTAPPTATWTPVPTLAGPVATTLGEANIRFGPGLEHPTMAQVPEGTDLRVLQFHAIVPWTRVALPDDPQQSGWIFNDVITITGDTSQVPVTETFQFGYPTPTPTPAAITVGGPPWTNAAQPQGTLANTLGQQMYTYLLEQGFAPLSDQIASVFVLDLQSGDMFTINDRVAYSGMSLTKIPILVAYFQRHSGPLSFDEAYLVADTMMCSENITTNELLAHIGEGDALRGAQRVTAMLQNLDLRGTFIMRQYVIRDDEPPMQVGTIKTGYDQTSTKPDEYNQMLPQDLGWLLASIYQCAQNGTGLLTERYPGDFTVQECRQMLYAMDANTINVFLEAGVPPGARVIHKHGWIEDTHGDAGIVIGPEAAYVFVVALYGEDHLLFNELSSPTIAELSRLAWNALNPGAPVEETTIGIVPGECDPRQDPVIEALRSDNLPMLGP